MCQQWFSVAGLVADVVGFLLIAWEWYRAFSHSVLVRNLQLHDAYERNRARQEGREPDYAMQAEEETMAKEFSKLHNAEAGLRRNVFLYGCGLVILGFALQATGSWPQADPIFGFRSC
jgi:hypothetical protein